MCRERDRGSLIRATAAVRLRMHVPLIEDPAATAGRAHTSTHTCERAHEHCCWHRRCSHSVTNDMGSSSRCMSRQILHDLDCTRGACKKTRWATLSSKNGGPNEIIVNHLAEAAGLGYHTMRHWRCVHCIYLCHLQQLARAGARLHPNTANNPCCNTCRRVVARDAALRARVRHWRGLSTNAHLLSSPPTSERNSVEIAQSTTVQQVPRFSGAKVCWDVAVWSTLAGRPARHSAAVGADEAAAGWMWVAGLGTL